MNYFAVEGETPLYSGPRRSQAGGQDDAPPAGDAGGQASRKLLVDGQGIPLEEFLSQPAGHWID
jgi:hypothetical protein